MGRVANVMNIHRCIKINSSFLKSNTILSEKKKIPSAFAFPGLWA